MIDAKSISEEQKAQIQAWADEGLGLPDIQRRMDDELKIKVTYMETRFLIDDLGITMPEEEKPEAVEEASVEAEEPVEAEESAESPEPTAGDEGTPETPAEDDSPSGPVSVTISELQRPGAMVSGSVTFANGESADWWMDQMGRLGMDPRNPEFKPTESDLMEFQKELQEVAKKKGY